MNEEPRYHQLAQFFISRYQTAVRPAIERGEYDFAHLLMVDVNLKLRWAHTELLQIIANIHFGFGLIGAGLLLERMLERKNPENIGRAE